MAHGAFAPEMMSSTKLSTVSAQMKRNGKSIKQKQRCPSNEKCYENLLKRLKFPTDEGNLGGNHYFFLTIPLLANQLRVICPELAQGLLRQNPHATSLNFSMKHLGIDREQTC